MRKCTSLINIPQTGIRILDKRQPFDSLIHQPRFKKPYFYLIFEVKMSINDITITPYILGNFYPRELVELPGATGAPATAAKAPAAEAPQVAESPAPKEFKALGANQKQVLVVVHYTDHVHLPDDMMAFLTNMLNACKLMPTDVVIINTNNYTGIGHEDILQHFQSRSVLLFGMGTAAFGFPFEVPAYQVQTFAQYIVIQAPSLNELQNDKTAKAKLWAGLKKIFNV
ncbi:MAG: hypothetical protein QM727_08950 [Niabella sp.]